MRRQSIVLVAMIALAAPMVASDAVRAQGPIEGRVDRLEREMRAVQRKLFPGGAGQNLQPQITAPDAPTVAPGTPASSPVADLNGRVNALEQQMTSLTGQIEQAEYKLRQLDEAFKAYRLSTDARLKAIEGGGAASAPADAASGGAPPPAANAAAAPSRPIAASAAAPKPAAPLPVPADPARAKLVAAIERPVTTDPADDAYVYGYRLWQAKYYPEAEAQLKQVVAKYPTHRRASWAQNLLGRTYLDQGKPSLASLAFYDNYKKFHDGERAPDSLFYLAVALKKLGKPSKDICQVYDELSEVYADKITPQMKADVARGRAEQKCTAS